MANENREYKDSVFTDLFYRDRDAKKNLLSLHNALFDEHLANAEQIELMRLEKTLFMNFENDVAYAVGDRHIVLLGHQSTRNDNLPLRILLYVAREYENFFPVENRYRKNRIAVPGSSFYVFYNGTDKYPTEGEMKLSDAFVTTTDSPMLEVKVKVININYANHHNILDKCQVLREYSMFVEKVRLAKSQANPLEVAVQQCIQEGILREYLLRKGSEVINMLIAEYDYDTDIRVQREEAAEEADEARGKKDRAKELATAKTLRNDGKLSLDDIIHYFHLTPEELLAF